jgi:serine/threonine protein kinase
LATLGRGNFGQVIKCRNKTDNFEYAIKVTNSRIRNPNEKEYYL